ncbi:unnamed protein product [Fraxinus pennsylvanica]|uniref:Bidirectional sugar transporter SWEET n=1 Tax=Fraxinus pennsylvanica TaxID=56036 RepID=A0AAD1ZE80_9LAMI|nr:unnamed protein product [Fraxinus pennsylvanica]
MALVTAAHMACTFGILGNITSFLVLLAPVPTFYRICKKKSTEDFQSIPYSVALFSATLYLYYAFLKNNVIMLITINSVICVFEVVFLTIFMEYATKKSKIFTTKLLVLFNIGTLGVIIGCTYFLSEGHQRVTIVGWICSAFSVSVFAAPLSIMRQVITTKSVEYMPLPLSFFLTICAVVWFFYGLFIKDLYIASPNVVGFLFGIAQMVLYGLYKNKGQRIILPETKLQDISTIIDLKAQDQMQYASTVEIGEVLDQNHGQTHRRTDLDPNEASLTESATATDSIAADGFICHIQEQKATNNSTRTIIDLKSQDLMQNSSTMEVAAVIDHNHGQAHRGTDLDPNEASLVENAAEAATHSTSIV